MNGNYVTTNIVSINPRASAPQRFKVERSVATEDPHRFLARSIIVLIFCNFFISRICNKGGTNFS